MIKILLPKKVKPGDTIGIISPSRPIYNIRNKINAGIKIINSLGYKTVFGKNANNHFYYSAGTPKERADDLNKMFANKNIAAIICTTGGITANETLPYINFKTIQNNPKPFIGYSDITTLLLAIYQKTGLITFHGSDLSDLSSLTDEARNFLFKLLSGRYKGLSLPNEMEIVQEGTASQRLMGGNIYLINGLLGTPYLPNFDKAILFWEGVSTSPAMLNQELMHLKLAGILGKASAIVIGHLSDCKDKKYPKDNRPINEIIVEIVDNPKIPIIKVNYFGHDINNFFTFPVGIKAEIDTVKKRFLLKF